MNQPRILVVEDTRLLRKIYTEKLTDEGYQVFSAGDGAEALEIMRREIIDLVLLDLIMPKMSGLEVLQTMHGDPRLSQIPVLILSNLGQQSDIERGIEMGAIDYLIKNEAKPIEVAEKIRATLEFMAGRHSPVETFRLMVKDRECDAERFIQHARLPRRLWCPACEVELVIELVSQPDRLGWYDAHVVCPMCAKAFG
ncbi:MAG: response regulator [Clostridiales bacterium]|nr:response regulator [Clostridiales bacterium]